MLLLVVGLGGVLGAYARYRVSGWVAARTGPGFPWGTLAVNLSGSFLLGLVIPRLELQAPLGPAAGFFTVGVIGAFTTFSTFAYEVVMLLQEGERTRAAAYVAGSLLFGLLGITSGLLLGRLLL